VRWKKFTQHSGGVSVVDSLLFLLIQLCVEGFITATFGLSALLRLPVVLEFPSLLPEGSLVSLLVLDIGAPSSLFIPFPLHPLLLNDRISGGQWEQARGGRRMPQF
jgi:hypothetical protein